MNTFRRGMALSGTPDEVFSWLLRPGSLERLHPPWGRIELAGQQGDVPSGGHVHYRCRLGPLSVRATLRHTSQVLEPPVWRFRDVQDRGPFAHWVHTNRVRKAQTGALLEDEVEWLLPGGGLGNLLGAARVQFELERTFRYRYRRIRRDLSDHARWSQQPRRVLVTGASGLIGRQLVALLTSGGHHVVRGVRRTAGPGEVQWAPAASPQTLSGFDAVVHLAGEPIGRRWTPGVRERVRHSRVEGTHQLAQALADCEQPPQVLICASAIGAYGERGDDVVDEDSSLSTAGFLAPLTAAWEAAADPAREAGVRVVHLRLGVVLDPRGGVLARLLPAVRWGLAGPVGRGRRWLSWIHLDDALRAVLHALASDVSGPLNAVSPRPVRSSRFASALGRALGRPALLPAPSPLLALALGDMGRETLLTSTRVAPTRLTQGGFDHAFPSIDGALADLLGA